MPERVNRGLPIARLLMVISSLAPLFLLWAGSASDPGPLLDRYMYFPRDHPKSGVVLALANRSA
jgi:hypothetical protein